MPIKKHSKNTGSTLIEVLIATIVVGVVLTGVVGAMTTSLKNSSEAQNRQVATRLAQEGLELFNQYKAVSSWSTFLSTPSSGPTRCIPNTSVDLATLQSATMGLVYSNCVVTGLTGVNTTFYRAVSKIQVNMPDGPAVSIKIIVQWQDGNRVRKVEQEKIYFNY